MKKILKALCLATILLLPLVGCNNDPDTEEITIQKQIDNDDTVDLNDETVSEDVTINKAVTLKNADFDGHTITVNADTTLIDIKNANVVIAGTNTAREAIIGKAITLTIRGNSTITSITVKIENAKITSFGDEVTITSLEIGSEAENVDISGGKIETLSVVFTDSETSKNVLNISGGVKIATTKAITESGSTVSDKSIYVTVTDEKTEKPNGVQSLDVQSVKLIKGTNVKTTYEVGDLFDFTDLSIKVTYSDGSTKPIQLSEINIKVINFSSSTTGDKTVSFRYADVPVSGTLSVTVNAPKEGSYADLLNKAVENFANLKLDEGITKIKEAYKLEENDTTKMYYALATLACVSTNPDTVKFMKETCGFERYPNEFNALIDTSNSAWWNDCIKEGFVEKIVKANPNGFNKALNELVKILENTYNEVVKISEGMHQASVLLPGVLIDALNLEKSLGSTDIRVGKAELDLIIAYFGIVKGTLEYISAFDWTFDTSTIKTDMDIDSFITAVKSGTKLLTTTNESMLATSKQSFIDVTDLAISTYDYMINNSDRVYPVEAQEILKGYQAISDAATALKDALKNGTAFYVTNPFEQSFEKWPTTENDSWFVKIDCGKAFSKGVADKAIEKDSSGRVQFYTKYWWYYNCRISSSESGSYYESNRLPDNEEVEKSLDDEETFASVHKNTINEVKSKIPSENVESIYWDCYTDLLIKVRLPDCITIKGFDDSDRETFLYVYTEYTDSYDDYN